MTRPRPRVASIAPALLFAALLPGAAAAAVEIYPGPGADTYRSTRYTVEVSTDGTGWTPAYVYQFSRKSVVTLWWPGQSPSVSFVTIGADEPIQLRVSKIGGAITGLDVSPKSKPITDGKVTNGVATGTVSPGDKYWLTINGDDANPLFVFIDEPKPIVPAGATYFGPGIQEVAPSTGNHYRAKSGETIYLDGGAWVRGNIDVHGTTGVHVMGPGILSGDLWTGEQQGSTALPFDQFTGYAMITGDFSYAGDSAVVEGITIVDSPGYNFYGGTERASGVKILSPWFYSTDAFQGVPHVDHSFVFNGDNIFMTGWAGLLGKDETFTSCFVATTLNSVFSGGYWGNPAYREQTALAEDIDVRTYEDDTSGLDLAAVFQIWIDSSDSSKGYRNQTYRDIRIEGGPTGHFRAPLLELKNFVYPWGGPTAANPPLGNGYDFVFQDIRVTGTQDYRNEIKGWDANNGIHGVILDNFSINGTVVDASNLHQYFDVNDFVWDLSFQAPSTPCDRTDSIGSGTSSRARIIAVPEPCSALVVGADRPK